MRILAIDPGTQRTGLAVCDDLGLSIRLLPVMRTASEKARVQQILTTLQKEGAHKLLVGLPLNMDGSLGAAGLRSQQLARSLEREIKRRNLACPVILWDERLTSFEAESRLRDKGIPKKKAKDYLDSLAAEVLLEDYLRQHHEDSH